MTTYFQLHFYRAEHWITKFYNDNPVDRGKILGTTRNNSKSASHFSTFTLQKLKETPDLFALKRELIQFRNTLCLDVTDGPSQRFEREITKYINEINPFACYYSAIEESLREYIKAGRDWTPQAMALLEDLENKSFQVRDIVVLKATMQDDSEHKLTGWMVNSKVLRSTLLSLYEEIPATRYIEMRAIGKRSQDPYYVYKTYIACLREECFSKTELDDVSWGSQIDQVKEVFEAYAKEGEPQEPFEHLLAMKKALLEICAQQLVSKVYMSPKIKEKIERVLAELPSARFEALIDAIPARSDSLGSCVEEANSAAKSEKSEKSEKEEDDEMLCEKVVTLTFSETRPPSPAAVASVKEADDAKVQSKEMSNAV